MTVTPLAARSSRAVLEALRAHGWDAGLAATAADGLHSLIFHCTGLEPGVLEALVPFAGTLGLDVVTGDGWAILAGSRARLSAFARPWTAPAALIQLTLDLGQAMPAEPAPAWRTARGSLPLDQPVLMGVLNVTPDSFSDGGRFAGVDAALAQADALVEAGAAIVDIGGESTRPGRTETVPAAVELGRILPVIEALAARHPSLVLTVDTVKSDVARAALAAGAAAINDVTALRLDPAMAATVATAGAGLVLMHSRGDILEIASYAHATYGDVAGEVAAELRGAIARAQSAGVPAAAIAVDPGLGFSKTVEQNIELFDRLDALVALGHPVVIGPSRKRFLGVVTGQAVDARDRATAAACALAWERGARIFRVHEVAGARDALRVARAVGGP